jgi:hypothetical protein
MATHYHALPRITSAPPQHQRTAKTQKRSFFLALGVWGVQETPSGDKKRGWGGGYEMRWWPISGPGGGGGGGGRGGGARPRTTDPLTHDAHGPRCCCCGGGLLAGGGRGGAGLLLLLGVCLITGN